MSLNNALNNVLEVRRPVDSGRNYESILTRRIGAAVVGNIRNDCKLASGGSAEGVSVLAYKNALVLFDKSVSSFLLLALVVPRI